MTKNVKFRKEIFSKQQIYVQILFFQNSLHILLNTTGSQNLKFWNCIDRLEGVFQDPSVCMHVCMLSMQASRSSKNQVSTRLSGMLQNTYGNKGLDTLFGPGRILDFWAPIVKNIRVFVHQSKNPHRQRDFEHTYTPEGCSATVQNPSACEGFWSVELCMYVC